MNFTLTSLFLDTNLVPDMETHTAQAPDRAEEINQNPDLQTTNHTSTCMRFTDTVSSVNALIYLIKKDNHDGKFPEWEGYREGRV